MKLRDSFMFGEPKKAVRPALGHLKDALAGIGDKSVRQAQDFLWNMGAPMSTGAADNTWRPAIGDEVEFEVPGAAGIRRAGRVTSMSGAEATVQVNVGEYNLVPVHVLQPLAAPTRRESKRAQLREALQGGSDRGLVLRETRALVPIGASGREYAMTVDYGSGPRPTEDDVQAFVQSRYAHARILDGDDSHPGRVALVLQFPDDASAGHAVQASRRAQLSGPKQPPSAREGVTGIGKEEIPGTGGVGRAAGPDEAGGTPSVEVDSAKMPLWQVNPEHWEQEKEHWDTNQQEVEEEEKQRRLRRKQVTPSGQEVAAPPSDALPDWLETNKVSYIEALAAANPEYDFVPTSVEESDQGTISRFAVRRDGRPVFVRRVEGGHMLSPVLADGVSPAIGLVYADKDGAYAGGFEIQGQLVPFTTLVRAIAPYSSGTGPLSMRENEPGANESGSYIIKAEERDASSPATDEEDGEVREHLGGPGLQVASTHAGAKKDDKDEAKTPTESYWQEYFGDYGAELTRDIPMRAKARVAMIKQAWAEAGRDEPTVDETLWVLGILKQVQAQVDAGTAGGIDPSAEAPEQDFAPAQKQQSSPQELTQKLLSVMRGSPQANQAVQGLITKFLAKMPGGQTKYRAEDPKTIKMFLPKILSDMKPKERDRLLYQFAPEEAGQKPGLLRRMLNRDIGKNRDQTTRLQEVDQLANDWTQSQSQSRAPQSQSSSQPGAQQSQPGASAQPSAQSGAAGAGAGMQEVNVPPGTDLPGVGKVGPGDKVFVQRSKQPGEAAQPGQAAKPAEPAKPAGQPAEPATPAQSAQPAGEPAQPTQPGEPAKPAQPVGQQPAQPNGGGAADESMDLQFMESPSGTDENPIPLTEPKQQYQAPQQQQQQQSPAVAGQKPGLLNRLLNRGRGAQKQADVPSSAEAFKGRLPPATQGLHFRMTELSRVGDYVVMSVVWDAEAAESMAPASVAHAIKSFAKQRASEKESLDLGFIGRPVLGPCDFDVGLAEVRFRSSESRVAPPVVIEKEEATYHEPIR